ncbi:EcoAI/FtnUII family type I restriction enzme subunit R [Chryseobacterium wangxinyae]|uniref:EcoAI/FtnUII family type I restriction enzme subunit R n=1 Tax=Chryseobacterium sp. CY353 TaxID=2997334 RepID=UPI003A4DD4A0
MSYSEHDTRAKFIDPQLRLSEWDEAYIIREHYFTDGRKLSGNKRGERLFVDYLLKYKNVPLAIIEAKRYNKQPTEGLQQAIDYAQKLKIDFVYSSNGKQIYEFCISKGKGDFIRNYPTPEEMYNRIFTQKNSVKEKLLSIPFYLTGDFKPRYYQEIAVNKVIEAIAEDKKRILLTLATGTGKTFISFQIAYKLFTARWNVDKVERRPKILFLADRNILADQAINTFNPLEKDLVKINGDEIRVRNGKVPTNANVFFAIYQAIAEKENIGGYYKQYPPDFFDIVIIDECHRGSANENGSWRDILDYFKTAVHLGLTATPKRNDNVNTYNYFGKPVYEYSLKDGINDGFLTPYKVKRIRTSIDEYIPTKDDIVVTGELEDRIYNLSDFENKIIVEDRTVLIARAILTNIREMDKTIVFCVNQEHALMMRDAINKHKSVRDPHYCVRVTSDEGEIGKRLLERFQDNDKDIPTILTSSQMLTTGVDARNVRNVVLVRVINSMVEFKQIVGRGTRIFDNKDFFTIIDFTGATNNFYDKDWDDSAEEEEEIIIDGEDEDNTNQPTKPKPKPNPTDNDGDETDDSSFTPPELPKEKIVVKLSNGRKVRITDVEVRYVGDDGRPLTVSEFLEKLIEFLPNLFSSEQQLRELWSKPESREELLTKLGQTGFDDEQIETLQKMFEAEESDIFDLLAFVSYSKDLITRTQRAETTRLKTDFFKTYENEKAQEFLYFILDRYKRDGIEELKRDKLSELIQLNGLGTTQQAAKVFGNANNLINAFYKLQEVMYQAV